MNEEILSFIWRYQYFERSDLRTDDGLPLTIIRPGLKNLHSGPDFSGARITIEGVEWAGTIEIHTQSSHWLKHRHENDPVYRSVILHVVWENDIPMKHQEGSVIPTLTLKSLVKLSVLQRYTSLIEDKHPIACCQQFSEVDKIYKITMLDRALLSRMESKATQILTLAEENQQDWAQTGYQWITKHFGFKLNDPVFFRLSQLLPLKTLLKHRSNIFQVESLLFGCAGLIPSESDAPASDGADVYVTALRSEYRFLKAKYNLGQIQPHEWKFMRLRPSGFPTVRLAQLAALIFNTGSIFSQLLECDHITELQQVFHLKQSDYWRHHYTFHKKSEKTVPFMGMDAANLLIINAVIPLLTAYARQREKQDLFDKALDWLSDIPSEDNHIIREWKSLGINVQTSADSQALIQQYNVFCLQKQCLNCAVGMELVRKN
ncbi:DUF2851 domain-containing protein [Dyadobacter luteus]|uniref:DUF2851 domain-containing protein n=1 Tax=Dyadobacter luteus TaxID=2259619 RepID=A0A3D8YE91_9BACT|nr:DUF2851 family protein [Dyadobacter luteus]REA62753.1 DUF2851 domain-containing protein [Dyadobacter luteus]